MKRFARVCFSTATSKGNPPKPPQITYQTKPYKFDPKVSLIITSGENEKVNQTEKERFNKVTRETAMGLYKNFKKQSNV